MCTSCHLCRVCAQYLVEHLGRFIHLDLFFPLAKVTQVTCSDFKGVPFSVCVTVLSGTVGTGLCPVSPQGRTLSRFHLLHGIFCVVSHVSDLQGCVCLRTEEAAPRQDYPGCISFQIAFQALFPHRFVSSLELIFV